MCAGSQKVGGFTSIDFYGDPDIRVDLRWAPIPLPDSSVETVVCISAINYFTRTRAQKIVNDVYRVLKPGGVSRFGVQDLEAIAKRYIARDAGFFEQRLPDGTTRFPGATFADKLCSWFYGYQIGTNRCRYMYDFESLAAVFKEAGFSVIERRSFNDSRIPEIELIDNRPDQMFFLEAVK